MTIAVRTETGKIALHSEPLNQRHKALRLPFVRGVVALYDAIALGLRGLRLSLLMGLSEEEKHIAEPHNFAWQAILGLSLAIVLFVALPHLISAQLPMKERWALSGIEGDRASLCLHRFSLVRQSVKRSATTFRLSRC
jgi:uncharacterized protein YqhQ